MRLLVAVALVVLAPGWAIVRHVPIDHVGERVMLTVAASVAVATAVAASLMYAGWWSPGRAVAALCLVSVGLRVPRRRPARSP